jgi:protein-L-isoaspartate(D-aspartate) O-methyltransferase
MEPATPQSAAKLRLFYARVISLSAGVGDPRIEQAFAAVPREPYVGPPPWFVLAADRYVEIPDAEAALLYQNALIALDPARGINIGEPVAHARWLDALTVQEGDTVLQVGAGSGYYTTILAQLAGPRGLVYAFEIDPALAERAAGNLAALPQVSLHRRSGIAEDLPKSDAIYVNAGITQPSWAWLDALRPGGRLLFPLQPTASLGGMLLICKPRDGGLAWPARFVSRARFIGCEGRQDEAAGESLKQAFAGGGWEKVTSFRLTERPDKSCWYRGDDWWLSTREPQQADA